MIKKAVKIQIELILPQGFCEYEFLEDLQELFDELAYIDACTAEVIECHPTVFWDIDALDSEN